MQMQRNLANLGLGTATPTSPVVTQTIDAIPVNPTEVPPKTIGNRLVTALVLETESLLLLCPQIFTDAFRRFHQQLQSD